MSDKREYVQLLMYRYWSRLWRPVLYSIQNAEPHNWEFPMGPTFSFLDLGLRKPTDTRLRLNQQPSLCEATLPNTSPPNLMLFVWIHSGKLNIIHPLSIHAYSWVQPGYVANRFGFRVNTNQMVWLMQDRLTSRASFWTRDAAEAWQLHTDRSQNLTHNLLAVRQPR